jgi:hypothetical protein
MYVIIAGSRGLVDRFGGFLDARNQAVVVQRALQCSSFSIDEIGCVISGANQSSPDAWGEAWARYSDGVDLEQYEADWDQHGRAAGHKRNTEMAEVGDALLAFWDGDSPGTKDMIDKSRDNGLDVEVVRLDKESVFQPLLGDLV